MSERSRRLQTLRDAVSVLTALRAEMPANLRLIGQAERQLVTIGEMYARQCRELDELARSKRKAPQRVTPQGRRKLKAPTQVTLPQTADQVGDYDIEAEAELRDVFDIPDGSGS